MRQVLRDDNMDRSFDVFSKQIELRKDRQADYANKQEVRRQKLEKRFRTCFIGNLDIFEKAFGFLWGNSKLMDQLTEDELKWRKFWLQTREDILNHSNHQMRMATHDNMKNS